MVTSPRGGVGRRKEEMEILKSRVRSGNAKLFLAWPQIREIGDKEERWRQMERWGKAVERLRMLCWELKDNYNDCLYLDKEGKREKGCWDNPGGFWCLVCSSDYPYWEGQPPGGLTPSSSPQQMGLGIL